MLFGPHCNCLVRFDEWGGYGRKKTCPKCGNQVSPETAYQLTALCNAVICQKCRKSVYPTLNCRCNLA